MTSDEKIQLITRYLLNLDTYSYYVLNVLERSLRHKSEMTPEDVLKLYRARVRYEALKEFSSDLEKLLYDNYKGG